MTKTLAQEDVGPDAALLQQFREAVSDDLSLIAALHDREVDAAGIVQLRALDFPSGLGLNMQKPESQEAFELMAKAMAELPEQPDQALIDELAVDYAAIYLTYRLRAAPTESVWLDKDHLERQQPMFQVRATYRLRGLKVTEWQKRSEDHLVTQLLFLAHLIGECGDEKALPEAARFLDLHLLRWIDMFAARVAQRCNFPFYGALALLTAAYLDELRDVLAAVLQAPRPEVKVAESESPEKHGSKAPAPPTPVIGPGW